MVTCLKSIIQVAFLKKLVFKNEILYVSLHQSSLIYRILLSRKAEGLDPLKP